MGQPPLESSIDIAATPDEVWSAVSDIKAMSRRSPELPDATQDQPLDQARGS